jgi:glycosyltransferase involved in cell wall biosynthesis
VVIVNDGSTDNTLDVLGAFKSDQRVIIHTQENQGCSPAVNNGIAMSKGQYVAVCGSDDFWCRDHVKLLVEQLEQHPETGMAFDNAEYFYNESPDQGAGYVVPLGVGEKLGGGLVTLQKIFEHNWVTACSFLVRREVLDKVGLFDPTLYMTGDLHLIYRIAAHRPIRFVDYVGVKIRIHGQNMSVVKRHYEFGVNSLEDLRDKYPEIVEKIGHSLFFKKLGRKYFRLGCYFERLGEFDKAREAYRKAVGCRRTRLRYYWSYLRLNGMHWPRSGARAS